jgi:hypothetical protein
VYSSHAELLDRKEIPVYNSEGNYVQYGKLRIAVEMFEFFAKDAEEGALFRFVKREDGEVTVRRVS